MWRVIASNRLLAALLLLVFLVGAGPVLAESPHEDDHKEVRGVVLSCHRDGDVWGMDATASAMGEIEGLGGNWVAIHPYAAIDTDGSVRMWRGMYEKDTRWLSRPVAEAHRLGLKIAIKPHLAYWGSPFSWRGEITFTSEEQWQRFFTTYEEWLRRLLELTAGADAFVVGTELDRTVHREREWRRLIEVTRELTDGPVTYGANWDSWESVPFWDALDVIGIQAYFPLVKHRGSPTAAELTAAWTSLADRLAEAGRRHGRPVLLTELGYDRAAAAARQPWLGGPEGSDGVITQKRCFDAALSAINKHPELVGAFLWKWFPERGDRGNFLLTTPEVRKTLSQHWLR